MNKRNHLNTVVHCLEERTMLAAGDEDQSQQPKQNQQQPKQNQQQPKQNQQQPKQNQQQPKQNQQQPKQNQQQPKQNQQQPKQNQQQPKQNQQQPKQNQQQPKQNQQQPKQNQQQPKQNQQQPKQNQQQPKQNQQQPKQNQQQPKQNQQQPKQNGNQKGPNGNQQGPNGNQQGPNGNQQGPNGNQQGPSVTELPSANFSEKNISLNEGQSLRFDFEIKKNRPVQLSTKGGTGDVDLLASFKSNGGLFSRQSQEIEFQSVNKGNNERLTLTSSKDDRVDFEVFASTKSKGFSLDIKEQKVPTSAEGSLAQFYSSSYEDPASAPKTIELNKKAHSELNALALKGHKESPIGEAFGTNFIKNGRVEVAEMDSAEERKLRNDPSATEGGTFHSHDNGTAPSGPDFFSVLGGGSKNELVYSYDSQNDPKGNKGVTYLLAKTDATTKGVKEEDFVGKLRIVPGTEKDNTATFETVKQGEFDKLFDKTEVKLRAEGTPEDRVFEDALFQTNKTLAKKYNLAFYSSAPGSNILSKVV